MVTMGEEVTFTGDSFKDYVKQVESTTKSAFTREYNKSAHRSQSLGGLPPGAVAAMRGGKRGGGGGGSGLGIGVDEDGLAEEEDALVAGMMQNRFSCKLCVRRFR